MDFFIVIDERIDVLLLSTVYVRSLCIMHIQHDVIHVFAKICYTFSMEYLMNSHGDLFMISAALMSFCKNGSQENCFFFQIKDCSCSLMIICKRLIHFRYILQSGMEF